MSKREIYLEAARQIAEGECRFACCAIDGVYHHDETLYSPERRAFAETFRPTMRETYKYGMNYLAWLASYDDCEEDARHVRVIALCLAAEAL